MVHTMQLTHNEVPGGGQNKICPAILVQLARLLCVFMSKNGGNIVVATTC